VHAFAPAAMMGVVTDLARGSMAFPWPSAGNGDCWKGLSTGCEHDPDARWLVVGCSLARGNADRLSDLDVAMGVTDLHQAPGPPAPAAISSRPNPSPSRGALLATISRITDDYIANARSGRSA
jgi:hypothetical protein